MTLETYKLLHIVAALATFAALGGLALSVANGATKQTNTTRKLIAMTHGIGTFLILLGGFGWVIVKLVVWLVVAGLVAIPYRKPAAARAVFWALPVLGVVAVAMALWKPF